MINGLKSVFKRHLQHCEGLSRKPRLQSNSRDVLAETLSRSVGYLLDASANAVVKISILLSGDININDFGYSQQIQYQ